MVDSDFAMLDRMRAATSPVMTTMIREDPMWTDPGMTVPRRGTRRRSTGCWPSEPGNRGLTLTPREPGPP